jgi:hypothetical protein
MEKPDTAKLEGWGEKYSDELANIATTTKLFR